MKEAIIDRDLKVSIRVVPKPKPGAGQVLIRVIVTGTNPKDWKTPKLWDPPDTEARNHGDDMAGYVDELGPGARGFAVGDRVAAFHEMNTPHGCFAEYAIVWDYCVFPIPDTVSFEGMPSDLDNANTQWIFPTQYLPN